MGIPARRAAVNHSFVSRLRRETSLARPKINPVRTVTRNGSTYQQDTRNGTTAHKPERPDELTDEEIARFNIPVCGF